MRRLLLGRWRSARDDRSDDRRALEEAEAFQRAALHALDQGIAMSDLQGRVLLLNRKGEELLGLSAPEVTERVLAGEWITYDEEGEVLPTEQRPNVRTLLLGESVRNEVVGWRRGDGRMRVFSVSTESILDPAGQRTGIVTAFFDVTEQRRAERRQRLAEAQLESERARFSALVERSSDIICLIDADGELAYASPAGDRLLGYAHGTYVGTPFTDLVHQEDLPSLDDAFGALLREPGGSRSVMARLKKADGTWLHTEVVATNRLQDPAVRGIVANVRDITERAQAAARLSWQAYHDPLTGLPNRPLLMDRLPLALDRSQRRGSRVGLLFLDLDGFKAVNDNLGHHAGDLLLVEVARRFESCVRGHDTVARFGGDEFIILAEDLESDQEALLIAQRVNRVLEDPILLPGGEVTVSASVGIAFSDGHDAGDLLLAADVALYRAKAAGKARYVVSGADTSA
jgi:diguanylate cyclase (GGDEF)-like protein/PAS domain S-box-containing protein